MATQPAAYPPPDAYEGGCKVSWYYYKDKAHATRAAAVAKNEVKRLEGQGYDWGFQVPGSVYRVANGDREGMYCVTIP